MNQTTIDFTPRQRPPRAFRVSAPVSHRDDPQSSKEAEERITRSGHRHTNAETVLRVLAAFCCPQTAAELVGSTGLDVVEVRRRLHDLHVAGMVNQLESRRCNVARTSAKTWAPTAEGRELAGRLSQ